MKFYEHEHMIVPLCEDCVEFLTEDLDEETPIPDDELSEKDTSCDKCGRTEED